MSQRPHERSAELQNHAEHAHTVAAASHTKNDRVTEKGQSAKELAQAEKALKKSVVSKQEEILPPPAIPGVTG